MPINWFTSPDDLIVWPDNTQCYRHELYGMTPISYEYVVIPVGSLHYPDENADFSRSGSGITIHSVDYDTVTKQRKAYVEELRVKLSEGE